MADPLEALRKLEPLQAGTAVLIPVLQVDGLVGDYRSAYTRGHGREPAHVTLLHPFFDPSEMTADVMPRLDRVVGRFARFSFVAKALTSWPDNGGLYLSLDPVSPFVDLIEALMAEFEETSPYWRSYDEIVPHITITEVVDQALRTKVSQTVGAWLPVKCVATEVIVIAVDQDRSHWETLHRFALPVE